LLRSLASPNNPAHIFICLADHFEPAHGAPSTDLQTERVDRWLRNYPASVAGLADSLGRPPQHTFFYPAEQYKPTHLDKLAQLCQQGYGDVEIHLHHDRDTPQRLRETLETFKQQLYTRHGLLRTDGTGRITYGFIHGNWALDNAHPHGYWCGVNNELTILRETGCYADFTLPSAPGPCQTRTINSIFYAIDHPTRPKSHDSGIAACLGKQPPADSLLMIQGPLAWDWSRRKLAFLPRLENGNLGPGQQPTLGRLQLWLDAKIGVVGRSDWRFVKLHTHGAHEPNTEILLGPVMRRFHEQLAAYASKQPSCQYYYVTAHELADLVHQAEAGATVPTLARRTLVDVSA
jgi:hypothetical protein